MSRPVFDPVDTAFDPTAHSQRDDVESPSLSSSNALARFEFEPGRSREGTKVLMVEWEDDHTTVDLPSAWEISWEGKRTVLPAKEQGKGVKGEEQPINRLYFLLGPGVEIPTTINLQRGSVAWKTNPLPAIFSPDLGATASQAGRKGVLHTIWAKKRLQVLQHEIEHELKENLESVGLEMATAEKEWIEQNFGITSKPGNNSISTAQPTAFANLNIPASPRSPGGGRLMDKLKGLKLGTSAHELSTGPAPSNPLSPEVSDIAVGSFGSFAALKGVAPSSTLPAKPAQPPQPAQRRIAVQRPPESLAAMQREQSGMGSLNALAGTEVGFAPPAPGDEQDEDDLFALPMSPRSPDMAKPPFSFGSQDTMRYLQGGKV